MIEVTNRSLDQMYDCVRRLEALMAEPRLNKRQESEQAALLSVISALKTGAHVEELRNWETNRFLVERGLLRLPEPAHTRLDAETEKEWRSFARGESVALTRIPQDISPLDLKRDVVEFRVNEAGQQSLVQTELTSGGAFVPIGMFPRFLATAKQYSQLFDEGFHTPLQTLTGSPTTVPVLDDVASASRQVNETTQDEEVSIANFGTNMLQAWTFRSGYVIISRELEEDSNFAWGSVLEASLAIRHARGIGAKLVSGSGNSTLTGLIVGTIASGAAVVVASGSSTNTGGSETGSSSIGSQDLAIAYGKLDPAYRSGAVWACHPNTLEYLDQLVDKMGRPLVKYGGPNSGFSGGMNRPYIKGLPVCLCPDMAQMSAAQFSVVLYNPAYFIFRTVPSSMYVRRFEQAYGFVERGVIGFQSFFRCDSVFVAPNSSFVPAVLIANHS